MLHHHYRYCGPTSNIHLNINLSTLTMHHRRIMAHELFNRHTKWGELRKKAIFGTSFLSYVHHINHYYRFCASSNDLYSHLKPIKTGWWVHGKKRFIRTRRRRIWVFWLIYEMYLRVICDSNIILALWDLLILYAWKKYGIPSN